MTEYRIFVRLLVLSEKIVTGRNFAARERLEMIPLGQPILAGHHSEKRHRKDLNRIDRHFAEAKEHHDKAEYFRRRAAAFSGPASEPLEAAHH
jgi:hypothetical protein